VNFFIPTHGCLAAVVSCVAIRPAHAFTQMKMADLIHLWNPKGRINYQLCNLKKSSVYVYMKKE
jgi:hypothetical protein